MTTMQRIGYQLAGQTVILLVIYAALTVLAALETLPVNPLADIVTLPPLTRARDAFLRLVIINGLASVGILLAALENQAVYYRIGDMMKTIMRSWTLLLILTAFIVLLDVRITPIAWYILGISRMILATFFSYAVSGIAPPSRFRTLFTLLYFVLLVLETISSTWKIPPELIDIVQSGIVPHFGHLPVAITLIFWLGRRFSNVRSDWSRTGVKVCVSVLAGAGVFIALRPVYIFEQTAIFNVFLVLSITLAVTIVAGHAHRMLTDPNHMETLAGYWVGLAIVLIIAGVGILGTILILQPIAPVLFGSSLDRLQGMLVEFATISVILAGINQTVAELREQNWRITGLLPFWCVTFGWLGWAIMTAIAGTAELLMITGTDLAPAAVAQLRLPVDLIGVFWLMIAALGIGTYALGFWARRV